jgi:hypothetical protein
MIGKLRRLETEVAYLRAIEGLVREMLDADEQRRAAFELAEEYNLESDWEAENAASSRLWDALHKCTQFLGELDRERDGVR